MQPQIKAIETVYKGFRFRSRLEARWAVFFDELGVRWEYEREGYDLGGVRYLPDFWLPGERMHVEVKAGPPPVASIPSVYFAGRMGEVLKGVSRECYRPFDVFNMAAWNKTSVNPVRREFLGVDIFYTGPFMTGGGNHCAVHGDADDYAGNESDCFARSLSGIRGADVIFAFLEDHEAFGTLAEIGFAHALKKPIVVGLGGDIANRVTTDVADHGFADINGGARHRHNELWFACSMADMVFAGDRTTVLSQFAEWIRTEHPLPREQKLIDTLARATGENACVVYGDPVEALESNGMFIPLSAETDIRYWRGVDAAAERARQARFEHGQSGASAR